MSNVKELLSTLNDHQLAYVNLDLPNPKNGQYMLVAAHFQANSSKEILGQSFQRSTRLEISSKEKSSDLYLMEYS